MQHILLFGAGKSATVLIQYLLQESTAQNWCIHIVDANKQVTAKKINQHPNGKAYSFAIDADVTNRQQLIAMADIVISLLPPHLHSLVAKDCILYKKNLLTASYVDGAIKAMEQDIQKNDLLFLCEMGLDPGIDHMSAMQLINDIKAKGGNITSFKSHCGGLVAPESDDNPWHYKISWNPRNVVLAGKAGAEYLENSITKKVTYEVMFAAINEVAIDGVPTLAYYPNRDSISYINTYNLPNVSTFIRTTLRYKNFIQAWNAVVQLKLTNEEKQYDSNTLSCAEIFKQHIQQNNLKDVLHNIITNETIASALQYLEIHTNHTTLQRGKVSIADVLQYTLESKLILQPTDKDMIVMQHEIDYTINNEQYHCKSTLLVKGDDAEQTAMAKTVGLPLGIAAKLILNKTIISKGLQIPISKEIYEPVLKELAINGIIFEEKIKLITARANL